MTKRIVSNPRVRGGEPCFEGTRIQAHVVQAYLDAGNTPAEIVEALPSLTVEDIEQLQVNNA